MVMKFDELKDVSVSDIDLDNIQAVSRRLGKIYNVDAIPVNRVTVFPIKGKLKTLLPEMHIFQCIIPISCTAVEGDAEITYYWMHNVERGVLFPVKPDDVEPMISSVYELLAPPKELTFEVVKEKPKIKDMGEAVVPPRAPLEELPTVEQTSIKPELVLDLPIEMQKKFGQMVYDSRWLVKWKAKMMKTKYRQLYKPFFLALVPDEKVERYASALISARLVENVISDIDMYILGITDAQLSKHWLM